MRKVFLAILLSLTLALVLFAVACNEQNVPEPTKEPDVTAEPTATADATPTAEPTATPEPTPAPTPTPEPEPGTYDLLGFEPDEGYFVGDGWNVIDDAWCGPLNEPGSDNGQGGATVDGVPIFGHREVTVVEKDGEYIPVIRLAIDGDEGYRLLGNRYGLGSIGLKPNTKYKIVAKFYVNGGVLQDNYSCLGYCEDEGVPVDSIMLDHKDEWQTETFIFKTSDNLDLPNIVLGPGRFPGACSYDYELLIEDIELYEVVEEGGEDTPEDKSILNITASGRYILEDTWTITDGKFCGPLQAPDIGTPDEAMSGGNRIFAIRGLFKTTLSDGSTGNAIRHTLIADYGYRNSGNFYGAGNVDFKNNTAYVLTVTLKMTGTAREGVEYGVGFAPTKAENLNDPASITDFTPVEFKDEWQVVTLEFTTPAGDLDPVFFIGEIGYDYCMLIESMVLTEKTAE